MYFKIIYLFLIISIVTMFCGLLLFSVSVQDKMLLASKLPLEKNKYKEVNELINKYIEEIRKPRIQRDLSWLHLV